jgi:simple sugar transport system permease protein
MLIGMLLIAATGNDPLQAYFALLKGSVGSSNSIARTLIQATPLILTGLSVAFAFRAGLFNIGATGQLIMGMLFSGWVALNISGPQAFVVPIEIIAAVIGGALWGALAGSLKAIRGAHEVITTIMLNYIAIRLGEWLLSAGGLLQDKGNPNPQSPPFPESAGFPVLWLPNPFSPVHLGIAIALISALAMWFIINRSTLGYKVRAVGLNPDAAEYGGISVTRTTIISMAIAGAFAGLAGVSIAVGDPPVVLAKSDFPVIQAGFTGIAVALLGRNTAGGVIVAALLFGALDAGAQEVQFSGGLEPGVATKLIQLIQGLIIFFVGCDMLFRRMLSHVHGGSSSKAAAAGGAH